MKLSVLERHNLIEMIETHTFYGIPLNTIGPEILDEIDTREAQILYIVASMIGWEIRDQESFEIFPFEAENYLNKFRKNPSEKSEKNS